MNIIEVVAFFFAILTTMEVCMSPRTLFHLRFVHNVKVIFDDCRAFADKRCLLNRGLDVVEQSFQPYLFVVLARPDTVFDHFHMYFV